MAYLIIRAMLERIDASMEEAALSLGASKFHIFRTVTLPLLAPGLAASFLLLFVESLADLGQPAAAGRQRPRCSPTEIYLSVAGQFDQQKAAVAVGDPADPDADGLSAPALLHRAAAPTSPSRASPPPGRIFVKEPVTRWTFIVLTLLTLALVLLLYFSHPGGLVHQAVGHRQHDSCLTNYVTAFTRGLNALLSTTFLSAVATPIAGLDRHGHRLHGRAPHLCGQADARLCLQPGRRRPRHDPGHRLHHRLYPGALVRRRVRSFVLLAGYLASRATSSWLCCSWSSCWAARCAGYYFNWLPYLLDLNEDGWRYLLALGYTLLAVIGAVWCTAGPAGDVSP